MGDERVVYFSTLEASELLGCSQTTVRRAAKRYDVGVHVNGRSRLVALTANDISRLRSLVHETSGNPDWIAAGRRRGGRRKTS